MDECNIYLLRVLHKWRTTRPTVGRQCVCCSGLGAELGAPVLGHKREHNTNIES